MVNLTLLLLSLPLLLQASPLESRVTKNALICDAGCSGSKCSRDVSPFGQAEDNLPFSLAKRHLDSAKDLDEQKSHYVANRINAKSEKGKKEALNWDYTTVDATSIDGLFKVSKDSDPNSKVGDDVDNMRAWVEGLEGCTGIAVVSEKGYWLTHLMEPGFFEAASTNRWQTKIIDPMTKGGSHFKTPKTFASVLSRAHNVKMYISTPSKGYNPDTNKFDAPAYDDKVAELVTLLTSGAGAPFPGVKPTIRKYDRPQTEAEIEKFRKTSKGKMLIEYTSNQLDDKTFDTPAAGQTALFRVWLEDKDYEHEWVVAPAVCELPKSPTKKPTLKERFVSFADRRAAKPKTKPTPTKGCGKPTPSPTKKPKATSTKKPTNATATKKPTKKPTKTSTKKPAKTPTTKKPAKKCKKGKKC